MSETTPLRPDPEQLLGQVRAGQKYEARGSFKVFLGYTSGVGKSARMLDEARRRKERGEDVLVGAVQPVISSEVQELLRKLEVIPLKILDETPVMDVESILKRRPQVCVIDGLAHHNHPSSQHVERWQDVKELLDAGISILASVNLQFIDDYKEEVEKITGKHVVDVVPLEFLKSAEEIEIVDAPPEMTFQRAGGIPEQDAAQQQRLSEVR